MWLANDTSVGDKATGDILGLGSGVAVANLGSVVSNSGHVFGRHSRYGQGTVLRNQEAPHCPTRSSTCRRAPLAVTAWPTTAVITSSRITPAGWVRQVDPSSLVDAPDIYLSPSLGPNGSSGPETLAITPNRPAFDEIPASACVGNSDERRWPHPGAGGSSCDAGAFQYLQLTVHVSGSEPYLSSNPSFTFSAPRASRCQRGRYAYMPYRKWRFSRNHAWSRGLYGRRSQLPRPQPGGDGLWKHGSRLRRGSCWLCGRPVHIRRRAETGQRLSRLCRIGPRGPVRMGTRQVQGCYFV